jgi:hypothetical protein
VRRRLERGVRRLAWLLPAAYAVHVAEEAPGFTRWARAHASERYSQRDFVVNNTLGFVGTVAATGLLSRWAPRPLVLAYYMAIVTQQALFNPVWHAGEAVARRAYHPGVVTSLVLFLPLWWALTRAALREHLLSRRDAALCVAVAGALHALVVAEQVYFVSARR